jgi:hypothetical protein
MCSSQSKEARSFQAGKMFGSLKHNAEKKMTKPLTKRLVPQISKFTDSGLNFVVFVSRRTREYV